MTLAPISPASIRFSFSSPVYSLVHYAARLSLVQRIYAPRRRERVRKYEQRGEASTELRYEPVTASPSRKSIKFVWEKRELSSVTSWLSCFGYCSCSSPNTEWVGLVPGRHGSTTTSSSSRDVGETQPPQHWLLLGTPTKANTAHHMGPKEDSEFASIVAHAHVVIGPWAVPRVVPQPSSIVAMEARQFLRASSGRRRLRRWHVQRYSACHFSYTHIQPKVDEGRSGEAGEE